MEGNTVATQIAQAPHGSPAWFHQRAAAAKGVEPETIMLTPALANELLKNNDGNRGTSPILVAQYAADMAADRWAFNGEPIIVSTDGKLNDGQHRCLAVIDSNTPIKTLVVFGVDRESRTTVDVGKKRTLSDLLSMDGVTNAALSAAIATMVIGYERSAGQNLHQCKFIPAAESKARVHNDAAIAAAAAYASHNFKHAKKYVGGSAIGFCHYILSKIDRTAALEYLDGICLGEGLRRKDAAHSVRERLLNEGKQRDKKVALMLRGWTFFRRNRPVTTTSLPATLPFPAIF